MLVLKLTILNKSIVMLNIQYIVYELEFETYRPIISSSNKFKNLLKLFN